MKRIAFDLHGVLDKYPEIFLPMTKILTLLGNHIFVISGPPIKDILSEIKELGYNNIVKIRSVVDYLKSEGYEVSYDKNGDPWFDEEAWWDAKAHICQIEKIDIMIDDSLKYKPAFKFIKNCKFFHVDKLIEKEK
jgi:hypothetical protein